MTVPSFVAVGVTVASLDGAAHLVVIETPSRRSVAVPDHGRVGLRLPGMRAGSYAVLVDGARAGTLLVGGEGGP